MATCFAQQDWPVGSAFCQEQYYSALCWVIAQLYDLQIFIGVFAVNKPAGNLFCTAALANVDCFLPRTMLQCTGAGSLHSCMNSKSSCFAQQHWPVVMLVAKNSVAVHWWHWGWVTAQLYEQQVFKGVFAVTQACKQPVLHSSTGQRGGHSAKNSTTVHCVGSLHSCMNSKSSKVYLQ